MTKFNITSFLLLTLLNTETYAAPKPTPAFQKQRLQMREKIMLSSASAPTGSRNSFRPAANDQASNLVDHLKYLSLSEIDAASLTQARLEIQPWTDSYWPIYLGGIAFRYADTKFPLSNNWKKNADFLYGDLGSSSVENLSPAEKYDLLVGDGNWYMTEKNIEAG